VKSSYDVHFLSQYERVNICWLLYWLLQFMQFMQFCELLQESDILPSLTVNLSTKPSSSFLAAEIADTGPK